MTTFRLWLFCAVVCVGWGCTKGTDFPVIQPDGVSTPAVVPLSGGRVLWHEWAQRDSALAQNRAVMLFLYSQRSIWCRQLVAQSFEQPELARMASQFAFPIWVNADLRPDLFERFGMGGLPSVAFLTADGRLIAGSTYMDAEDFQDLLRRVYILYDNPDRMVSMETQRVELMRREALDARRNPKSVLALNPALVGRVGDSIRVAVEGGEAVGAEGLRILLDTETHHTAGIAALKKMLAHQQDVDGTFFLSMLTADGAVVDREKHLAVNAGVLLALARAAQIDDTFQKPARALGEALLVQFGMPNDSLLCAGWAGFDDDAGQVPRDVTVISGWNGLAVSGLVAVYRATGDRRFLDAGTRILNGILARFRRADGLLGRVDGRGSVAFLEDQALIARAMLDVFEAHGKDLKLVTELVDGMLRAFATDSGVLRDRAPELGVPVMPVVDRWAPSGNGVAAQVLVRLATHTGQVTYRRAAQKMLRATIGPHMDRVAYMGALGHALGLFVGSEPAGLSGK